MGDRSSWAELSSEFRRQHFLVGLCLTNLFNALEQENGDVHTKSISLVRNLLTTHDLDPRYSEPECRARVANLYLPVIGKFDIQYVHFFSIFLQVSSLMQLVLSMVQLNCKPVEMMPPHPS